MHDHAALRTYLAVVKTADPVTGKCTVTIPSALPSAELPVPGDGLFVDFDGQYAVPTVGSTQTVVATHDFGQLMWPGSVDDKSMLVDSGYISWMLEQITDKFPPHIGEIYEFATTECVPSARYLVCDGSAKSRTTYAELFAKIGTTWGAGNGSTTFNIPDFRGRSSVGYSSTIDVGDIGGSANSIVVSHSHTASFSGNSLSNHNHSINPPSTSTSSDAHTHTFSDTTSGQSANHVHGNGIPGSGFVMTGTGGNPDFQVPIGPGYDFSRSDETNTVSSGHNHTVSGTTSSDSHSHTVNIAAFNSESVSAGTPSGSVTVNSNGSSGTNANYHPYAAVVKAIYAGPTEDDWW